jgi:hypothetical protein
MDESDKKRVEDFYDQAVRKAEENWALFSGSSQEQTATLRKLIESADLVFGVYPAPLTARGVDFRIIKGEGFLTKQVHEQSTEKVRWNAVPCRSAEEAEAMRQTFGDKSVTH